MWTRMVTICTDAFCMRCWVSARGAGGHSTSPSPLTNRQGHCSFSRGASCTGQDRVPVSFSLRSGGPQEQCDHLRPVMSGCQGAPNLLAALQDQSCWPCWLCWAVGVPVLGMQAFYIKKQSGNAKYFKSQRKCPCKLRSAAAYQQRVGNESGSCNCPSASASNHSCHSGSIPKACKGIIATSISRDGASSHICEGGIQECFHEC